MQLLKFIVIFLAILLGSCKRGRSSESDAASTSGSEDPGSVIVDTDKTPVDQEKPSTVKESVAPKIVRLVFPNQKDDQIIDSRYLSEYLLVVRASKESCIRLAIKPGPDSPQLEDDSETQTSADNFCEITKNPQTGASDPSQAKDSDGSENTNNAETNTITETKLTKAALAKAEPETNLGLMSRKETLCSERIFRFDAKPRSDTLGAPAGLDSIVTKTSYLVAQSEHVNLWLDAEVDNPCLGSQPADLEPIGFALALEHSAYGGQDSVYQGALDQITKAHYKNIVLESEKIYTRLTSTFGSVSDVDGNNRVDIVISPEINRNTFYRLYTSEKDDFLPAPINKRSDLSAYDGIYNPLSNEGEVIYAWAPDPGGIYQYSQYPTANSITSNFFKGYIAYQMMSLIMFNQDLTTRKNVDLEEEWLVQSLSMLASSYVAGNDYSIAYSSEYLSTRTQYLPLRDEPLVEKIPDNYKDRAVFGVIGYRTLFGWFLHTKLCGTQITPCAELKDLIQSTTVGEANLNAKFKQTLAQMLDQFGTTLGIEMSENPSAVRDAITAASLDIATPLTFPSLGEIYSNDPPQTVELNKIAQVVPGSKVDRAVAGPLPSKRSMLYQTVLPDYPIEMRLAKDGIAYILITGLISEDTELKTHLGANAQITIIPLGKRNNAKRKIHVEKLSEAAHMDLRPINLSKNKIALTTAYRRPEYAGDFTVSAQRELWIIGSIDNYTVNEVTSSFAPRTIADVDSYHISVDPCLGSPNESTCRNANSNKTVLIQAIPRDFKNELLPMMLVTPTELAVFRGQRFLGHMHALDGAIYVEQDKYVNVACHSEATVQSDINNPDFSNFSNCANAGMTKALYQTEVCNKFMGACADGMPKQSVSFNAYSDAYLTSLDPSYIGPTYDNYFHAGPKGFPFLNNNTIAYPTDIDFSRNSYRPFRSEEIDRQFFNFSYTLKNSDTLYRFYPVFAGINAQATPNFDQDLATLDVKTVGILNTIKDGIANNTTLSDGEVSSCVALGLPETSCKNLVSNYQTIDSYMMTTYAYSKFVCIVSSLVDKADLISQCPAASLTVAGNVFGSSAKTSAWLSPDKFIVTTQSPSDYFHTYYRPTFPLIKPDNLAFSQNASKKTYCRGEVPRDVEGDAGFDFEPCLLDTQSLAVGDIRSQLNVPVDPRMFDCHDRIYPDEFLVCADFYSYGIALDPGKRFSPVFAKEKINMERNRSFLPFSIAKQKGEYLGKEKSLHYISFLVKSKTATDFHLMLSGLNLSTGKYFLRVRVME